MRVSLVTGGGRGIGRAIAHALAGPDTCVAVAARTRSEVDSTARELAQLGGRSLAIVMDVSDEASVTAGIADLVIMKTSRSAFAGYPRDEFTTLPETHDRLLATAERP